MVDRYIFNVFLHTPWYVINDCPKCLCLQVKKVLNSGVCSKDGRIHVGDRLVAIEGHELRGVAHSQCINLLQEHSNKNQVTLQLLRQSKQDDTVDILNGDFTDSQSSAVRISRNSTGSIDGSNSVARRPHTSGNAESKHALSNIEIDHEHAPKHSQVHHNQIFAQQHVKLAYARNSFRVKKNRQIPKIPKEEDFNRSEDNNSNESSQSDNSNASDVSTNSSETEHDRLAGLRKHQTVENLNKIDTSDSEKLIDSESSRTRETSEEQSTDTERQFISQDQRSHANDMDVNKNYEGSGYIETSDLHISSESAYVGDENSFNVPMENADVTLTKVDDYYIPKGYQRYEMSHPNQEVNTDYKATLDVIDSDSDMDGEGLLSVPVDKVQELLASTPPGGEGFLSTTPHGEAPPPPPEFFTDDDEAPALPSDGPPSVPPPAVPRSRSPTSSTSGSIEKYQIKEQSRHEVSQTLSDKMKFLDQILNDDTLPVTNIDDLLDDVDDYVDDDIHFKVNKESDAAEPGDHEQVHNKTSIVNSSDSSVLSPRTSADLKHALVNPFEQLERDFDNDATGSRVMVEGMSEGLHGAHTSDVVENKSHSAGFDGEGDSCENQGSTQFAVVGMERVSVNENIRTTTERRETMSTIEYQKKVSASVGPPVLGDLQVFSSTFRRDQAPQSSSLHDNTHSGQQQKQPSSSRLNAFVSSSHAESDQFTELEHNFNQAIDLTSGSVTVVRITSPSTSLQHLTPLLPEDTSPAEAQEAVSDTEADQPPPLPTTDIPPQSATKTDANLLIDDFVTDANRSNSTGVDGVSYYDDQHGPGSLDIGLDAEVSDVDESFVKLSADTLSTNISLRGANEDTYESVCNITDLVNVDPTSNTVTSGVMQFDQKQPDEQFHFPETTTKVNELTVPDVDKNEEITEDNNFFDSKEVYIFEQNPDTIFSNSNTRDEALIDLDQHTCDGNGTSDNSNVNNTSQSHTEESHGDVNCSLDPLGQRFNTFTEERNTGTSLVQNAIELKNPSSRDDELAVEVTPDNKKPTDCIVSVNNSLEEVISNPANVYHTTQLSDAMKTTGDIDKVNAHGNSVDVTASHNNFTANSDNQTVTDSLTHETLVKTISECGSDDTRGNRVNLSSMSDVQFDISSTKQSGFDIKSVSNTVAQDVEQSLSPGKVHLKTETPTFPLLSPRSLHNVSETRTKPESDAVDRHALPALKLPKLSSFESRKLSPVSPKTFSMKSSSSLNVSDLSKTRNKRSEVGPFTVEVLKGLLGLGIKLNITKDGFAQVVDVLKTGPVGRSALVRFVCKDLFLCILGLSPSCKMIYISYRLHQFRLQRVHSSNRQISLHQNYLHQC